MALTPKQARFAEEYLVDLNATKAAERAGYSQRTARAQGSRLLLNVDIQQTLASGVAKRSERTQITADVILGELLRIARVDIGQAYGDDGHLLPIHEIPEDVRRALIGVEAEELYEWHEDRKEQIGITRKVRFADKIRALELLGKHLKLFSDRLELTSTSSLADRLAKYRQRTQE